VVVELWDRPEVEQPQAPPPPTIEPRPEPKLEPKPAKPDIAIEKQKKVPPKKEEPKLKIERDSAIREELAREMEQVSRERERRSAASKSVPTPAGPVIDPTYANLIKARIKSNIMLPQDLQGNPEAIFDVVQLPTGEVSTVKLRKSSGHRGYDDAVERAILKSSPLPRPIRPDQFMRELQLKFRPQE
jgi:colicin import membrane protein